MHTLPRKGIMKTFVLGNPHLGSCFVFKFVDLLMGLFACINDKFFSWSSDYLSLSLSLTMVIVGMKSYREDGIAYEPP